MSPGDAERRPCQDAAASVPTSEVGPSEATAPRPVVTILERKVSAVVQCPDAESVAIVRRVVPAPARDRGAGYGEFAIFGSHVRRLAESLSSAGYVVEREAS